MLSIQLGIISSGDVAITLLDCLLTLIIVVGEVLVLSIGVFGVVKLWSMVLDVVAGRDTRFVAAVRRLIGSVDTKKAQWSFVGIGLLGTLFIIAVAGYVAVCGVHFTFKK